MTTEEAYMDFWQLIHANGTWLTLNAKQRAGLSSIKSLVINGGVNQKGSPQRLTARRALLIFEKYAPGEFRMVSPEPYFTRG